MKLYKFTLHRLEHPDVWIIAESYSGAQQLLLKSGKPEYIVLAMSVVADTDSGSLLLDKQMKGCL